MSHWWVCIGSDLGIDRLLVVDLPAQSAPLIRRGAPDCDFSVLGLAVDDDRTETMADAVFALALLPQSLHVICSATYLMHPSYIPCPDDSRRCRQHLGPLPLGIGILFVPCRPVRAASPVPTSAASCCGMLPVAIVLPIAIVWLRLTAAGMFDSIEFGAVPPLWS